MTTKSVKWNSCIQLFFIAGCILLCSSCSKKGGGASISAQVNASCPGATNFTGNHVFAYREPFGAWAGYAFIGGYTSGDTKEMGLIMQWPPALGTYSMGGAMDINMYYDPVNSPSDPLNPADQYGASHGSPGTVTINSVTLGSSGQTITKINVSFSGIEVMDATGNKLCISGTINY